MDDLISKQAAIDAVRMVIGDNRSISVCDAIKQLPLIQPKRGRWIKLDMHRGMADHKCTACEQECYVPTCMGEPMYAFCPNCGARMGGDNMRLIDADAFDERVRVAGGMSEEELTEDFKDGVQAVLYMLSNQPTIQPEPHWIPVTERLPEDDGNYLVSGKWGSGKESVGDCEFSVEDGYFQTAWNFDVLAWMPLPEPFKEVTK